MADLEQSSGSNGSSASIPDGGKSADVIETKPDPVTVEAKNTPAPAAEHPDAFPDPATSPKPAIEDDSKNQHAPAQQAEDHDSKADGWLSKFAKNGADECLTAEQLQKLRSKASSKDVTDEVADELSAALALGESIRSRDIYIEGAADRLTFIYECLAAEKPKLILARDERLRMQLDLYQKTGFVSRILAKISAGSPVALVVSALLVSLVIWAGLVLGIRALVDSKVVAVARDIFFMNGQALAVMTSAAFVGGVISIATRLQQFSRVRDLDPFAMFWTALLKPLIGVVLALFILATLAGGIISFGFLERDAFTLLGQTVDADKMAKAQQTLYVLFVLGFLAGFSERFAWDFVDRAQGVANGGFSGDKAGSPAGAQGNAVKPS